MSPSYNFPHPSFLKDVFIDLKVSVTEKEVERDSPFIDLLPSSHNRSSEPDQSQELPLSLPGEWKGQHFGPSSAAFSGYQHNWKWRDLRDASLTHSSFIQYPKMLAQFSFFLSFF